MLTFVCDLVAQKSCSLHYRLGASLFCLCFSLFLPFFVFVTVSPQKIVASIILLRDDQSYAQYVNICSDGPKHAISKIVCLRPDTQCARNASRLTISQFHRYRHTPLPALSTPSKTHRAAYLFVADVQSGSDLSEHPCSHEDIRHSAGDVNQRSFFTDGQTCRGRDDHSATFTGVGACGGGNKDVGKRLTVEFFVRCIFIFIERVVIIALIPALHTSTHSHQTVDSLNVASLHPYLCGKHCCS